MAKGRIRKFVPKSLPQKQNWKEGATGIIGKTNSETHFIDEYCTY